MSVRCHDVTLIRHYNVYVSYLVVDTSQGRYDTPCALLSRVCEQVTYAAMGGGVSGAHVRHENRLSSSQYMPLGDSGSRKYSAGGMIVYIVVKVVVHTQSGIRHGVWWSHAQHIGVSDDCDMQQHEQSESCECATGVLAEANALGSTAAETAISIATARVVLYNSVEFIIHKVYIIRSTKSSYVCPDLGYCQHGKAWL